ncbi:MAG: hypothetical protein PSU93_09435 [Methylobacter sp.]|uniref:Uncharacterized protein n=1 Tax=Candidatus Methylobacter titanis TaxID=3053457 RepID=A0AA43Q8S2_9GAMM|nr:hypothetical protein [Candidatus Methylobacter titanis]
MATPEKPTKQQWDEVKDNLTSPYGRAYLRCDSYLIAAMIEQHKMTLLVAVYVNGWFRGSEIWHGKESDMDKMGDIARRFYCLKSTGPSAKKIASDKKIFGAKWCKERGWHDRSYFTFPRFRTPGAFIAHIKKHNESIEVLDYETYKEALNALPIEGEHSCN